MRGGGTELNPKGSNRSGEENRREFCTYFAEASVFAALCAKLTVTSCEATVPVGPTATRTYLPAKSSCC